LRAEWSRAAKDENKTLASAHRESQISTPSAPSGIQVPAQFGTLGLGDLKHGLSTALLGPAIEQPQFVKQADLAWKLKVGTIVEPLNFSHKGCPCGPDCIGACKKKCKEGIDPRLWGRAMNCLKHLARMIRDSRRVNGKAAVVDITGASRHVLFLVRGRCGNDFKYIGWIVSFCSFSPLELDFIRYEVPPDPKPLSELSMVFHLLGGVRVPKTEVMHQVARELAELARQSGGDLMTHCPGYNLWWETAIHVLHISTFEGWAVWETSEEPVQQFVSAADADASTSVFFNLCKRKREKPAAQPGHVGNTSNTVFVVQELPRPGK
jgi:hypothetical protein